MNNKGFTLIELLVALGILAIIIGIPYAFLTKELKHTVKESALSQSALEKIPSLEILRKDIEDAGYGLVRDNKTCNGGILTYDEASSTSHPSSYSPSIYPALFNDAPSGIPKAIIGKKDTSSNGFSYLVLKGTSLGLNKACKHWSYIDKDGKNLGDRNIWPTTNSANYNNFKNGDRVVVMDAGSRKIVENSGKFYFTIGTDDNSTIAPQSVYLIYGVGTSDPRAPFNRVDYYLKDSGTPPSECATGTHTLYRMVMNSSGNFGPPYYPLLHCVADFQVGFGLDTDEDEKIDTWTQDITTLTTAKDVRDQLKQVRIYILVQNGTKDKDYNYPHNSIYVGDNSIGIGRNFDLTTITDYKHYHWKLIKLVVEPKNLGAK